MLSRGRWGPQVDEGMEMATRGETSGEAASNGLFSERRKDNLKANEDRGQRERRRGGDVGVGVGRWRWGHQVCCLVGGGGREHW